MKNTIYVELITEKASVVKLLYKRCRITYINKSFNSVKSFYI
jgi:hypothetical protein